MVRFKYKIYLKIRKVVPSIATNKYKDLYVAAPCTRDVVSLPRICKSKRCTVTVGPRRFDLTSTRAIGRHRGQTISLDNVRQDGERQGQVRPDLIQPEPHTLKEAKEELKNGDVRGK